MTTSWGATAQAHNVRQQTAALPKDDRGPGIRPWKNLRALAPHVLFFLPGRSAEELMVLPVRVANAVAKLDYDLGAIRIGPHAAFPSGYPSLDIEPFGNDYEG